MSLGVPGGRTGDRRAALPGGGRPTRPPREPERIARVHRKMAASLEDRGDIASASTEVETGRKALGETLSAERGWLDVIRCRIAYRLAGRGQAREAGGAGLGESRACRLRAGHR